MIPGRQIMYYLIPLCLILAAVFILQEKQENYTAAVILKGLASLCFVVFGLSLSSGLPMSRLITAGLMLGCVADVLLNLRFVLKEAGQIVFLVGILVFLSGHIMYLAAILPMNQQTLLCIIAGIVLWIVTIPFVQKPWQMEVRDGLIGGLAIGGGMLILSLIFDRIIKKDSLGGGDIKLYFMTGLFLGWKAGFFNLILSCLVGLIFVLLLKKSKIPFGPSISIATLISIIWGDMVVSWYFSLFM